MPTPSITGTPSKPIYGPPEAAPKPQVEADVDAEAPPIVVTGTLVPAKVSFRNAVSWAAEQMGLKGSKNPGIIEKMSIAASRLILDTLEENAQIEAQRVKRITSGEPPKAVVLDPTRPIVGLNISLLSGLPSNENDLNLLSPEAKKKFIDDNTGSFGLKLVCGVTQSNGIIPEAGCSMRLVFKDKDKGNAR